MLEDIIIRENSISYYLDFISSQVLTPFSFSNAGVVERKNLKGSFSQKFIFPLIILGSRFYCCTTSKPFPHFPTSVRCSAKALAEFSWPQRSYRL